MCGVFAAFVDRLEATTIERCHAATQAVKHRGPDNLGTWNESGVFLGHTRLAIVGLEAASNQPFLCEHLAIVFNGEIFNYLELRSDLQALGDVFTTGSDTEVVARAFLRWGESCFERFNGMWAIVIYDRRSKKLVVSRDRFGQKPLFLAQTAGGIFIASEPHQLLPFVGAAPDLGLIQLFLKEGQFSGGSRTFFRGVSVFPKAHTAEISGAGQVVIRRYWRYPSRVTRVTNEASFSEFAGLLEDAVRLRLRSDVPCGLLMSGGIDSTVVTAIARKLLGPQAMIPVFTYSSCDRDDETSYALKVAEHLGFKLTIRERSADVLDYRKRLRSLVHNMGRGHSSPAIVSIDGLYEAVAQAGVRVALDGQGADELLCGYWTHHILLMVDYLRRRRGADALVMLRQIIKLGFTQTVVLHLRNHLPPALRAPLRRVYGYENLFAGGFDTNESWALPVEQDQVHEDALNRHLISQHSLGLENLLYYGDIVAMRHAVENRSPCMDHRLVEFSFQHDSDLKVHAGRDKYALRTLPVYRELEQLIVPRKIGFASSLHPEVVKMMIRELENSPVLSWPILNTSAIQGALRQGTFAKEKFHRLLFRLYQVHLWSEIFDPKGVK